MQFLGGVVPLASLLVAAEELKEASEMPLHVVLWKFTSVGCRDYAMAQMLWD